MYGVMYDVAAPVELYDRVAAAIDLKQGDVLPEGMLTHLAMPTDDGFRIVEVWATKEDSDRFGEATVGPTIVELGGETASAEPTVTEFEVRRLVLGAPEAATTAPTELPSARRTSEQTEYIG